MKNIDNNKLCTPANSYKHKNLRVRVQEKDKDGKMVVGSKGPIVTGRTLVKEDGDIVLFQFWYMHS